MDGTDLVWFDQVRITNASRKWMSSYVYGSSTSRQNLRRRRVRRPAAPRAGTAAGRTLENNGACGSVTTPGKDNGQGPGTAGPVPAPSGAHSPATASSTGRLRSGSRNPATAIEYMLVATLYYRGHEQTMMVAPTRMPGWPDIAVTIADQAGFSNSGVARFGNVVDHPG